MNAPSPAAPVPLPLYRRLARRLGNALESPRVRRVLRTLRHGPDRVLHGARRRSALRSLRRRGAPASVLFLCQGNICRSPYAAAAFTRALPEPLRAKVRVASQGFLAPDRPPPAEALAVAAARGLDLSGHRSSLLSRESIGAAALVVVMAPEQARAVRRGFGRAAADVLLLGDLDPRPIETRAIRDPWGQKRGVFAKSFARIDRCVAELVSAIAAGADHHSSNG